MSVGDVLCSSFGDSALSAVTLDICFTLIILFLLCKLTHLLLRRFRLPRIISELLVGLVVGNISALEALLVSKDALIILSIWTRFGLSAYLFIVGLEMDPFHLLTPPPSWEAIIAYSGIATTALAALALRSLLDPSLTHSALASLAFAAAAANTSSPILTRLTTSLKIERSSLGRLVVSVGIIADMVSTMLMVVLAAFNVEDGSSGLGRVLFLVFESVLVYRAGPRAVKWIEDRNPAGKPLKGSHLALSCALIAVPFVLVRLTGFDLMVASFVVGLALPRDGRVSRLLIAKVNYLLSSLCFPLYLCHVGMNAKLRSLAGPFMEVGGKGAMREVPGSVWRAPMKFALLGAVGVVAKGSGPIFASLFSGLHVSEATAVGLLLMVCGHYHLFLALTAFQNKMISVNTYTVVVVFVMGTIVAVRVAVAIIVRRVRRQSATGRLMALQWTEPYDELRVVFCLHGPHNVPAAVHVIESLRGSGAGDDAAAPAPLVYAMDLIKLNERVAATMITAEEDGEEAVTVADEEVAELREQIGMGIAAYERECEGEVRVRRTIAVSELESMHEDVCNAAEELAATLIVLPFHKRIRVDGGMDASADAGFQMVNQKVLRHAPCSVAILVDRGLARVHHASASIATVAVVFIGGRDDREALAYAERIAGHPGMSVTVVRFMPDAGARMGEEDDDGGADDARVLAAIVEREAEAEADEECFAGFYERNMLGERVGYVEKRVGSGADTVAMLRALEGMYELFVVGRGARGAAAVMTSGMGDWEECPELGPIGDVIASSDFSVTASVLVVQQHCNRKGRHNSVDEDFSIL
ncbi:Cation/H(+) antiporter 28 [Acorus gramineus]|uniref:Cation/H(+) antiporter 28 n=1 Tax=Acorus gramineus TaxID=55184 RepID=A0AAV9AGX3_ACOGR|nr:Cation/H(+) antiporter 28 [Acorus gramineus]